MSPPLFEPIDSPVLTEALRELARAGAHEMERWPLLDYLSPGDVARLFLLREMSASDRLRPHVDDAIAEILAVAERRAQADAAGAVVLFFMWVFELARPARTLGPGIDGKPIRIIPT